MEFILKIRCRGAAFGEDGDDTMRNMEVIRILDKVKVGLDLYRTEGPCLDINGNTVGGYEFVEESA